MRKLFGLATFITAFFLVACDGDPSLTNGGTGGTGGGGGGGGGDGGDTIPDLVSIGSGTGDGFAEGVIDASQTMLQAGGSASLSVNFVDVNNNLVADEITVTFSSPCAAGGLANIVENSVLTNTGSAIVTYSATGCAGDDLVTATANVDGSILMASQMLTVEAATVGSIEFVSAEPENIGLLGTGGVGRQETSTVRFRVTDSTSGPVSGADVDFTLNSNVGGINLTPTTASSDAQGFVQTVVSAGSVATSVRVTATVKPSSPVIATQSDQLTVTTGIPDNDSVSTSLGCINLEAWDYDGVATPVTVRLSDRYNNPVPDGTAVTLSAEGGQVGGSCVTATTEGDGAGVCSVTWVSQAPRPSNGRVTILATAIGEESFIDQDANGQFNGNDVSLAIGEPYRDDNENGTYELGEVFSDFNSNGLRDNPTHPDYLGFNGLLCDPAATETCNANDTLFVSDSAIVVMSSSAATITDNVGGTLDLTSGVAAVTLFIGDAKGNGTTIQPMPGGTTIKPIQGNGQYFGPQVITIPCSSNDGPVAYTFTLGPDPLSSFGVMSFLIESPRGVVTTYTIGVND